MIKTRVIYLNQALQLSLILFKIIVSKVQIKTEAPLTIIVGSQDKNLFSVKESSNHSPP
jgi:hypothetical protein